jgi:acyl carrier protein
MVLLNTRRIIENIKTRQEVIMTTDENNQNTAPKIDKAPGAKQQTRKVYHDLKEISDKVVEIIADVCRVDRQEIVLSARIVEDIGADSLDVVEIVLELESHFGCDIKDDEASKISTVQDAVTHIAKSLSVTA